MATLTNSADKKQTRRPMTLRATQHRLVTNLIQIAVILLFMQLA